MPRTKAPSQLGVQGQAMCGSAASLLAELGCLLTCQPVCVCCKAWLEGSNSPSPFSLIMQGKDWVKPGGWQAGRLLA